MMSGVSSTAPLRLIGRWKAGRDDESASAALLLAATAVAVIWANSPWPDSYESFWHTELAISLGDAAVALDLRHWVNDGLMVFFFYLLGLEVKRELVLGELADRRRAAVPVLAALTGLAVPALLYLAVAPAGEARAAWGVVISTDTAFMLGVLALIGPACPTQLRVFLLTLSVADDVGALTVIAVFFTDDLDPLPLALAGAGIALTMVLRRLEVWRGPAYFLVGAVIWLATYESGVHPTIAGVLIALLVPTYEPRRDQVEDAARAARRWRQSPDPGLARAAGLLITRSISPNDRLQRLWGPWVSFLILPIFALANAGVRLDGESVREAATSPVTLAVVLGLVLGKPLGIWLGAVAAVKAGLGEIGAGITRGTLAGGAALTGIGFTLSLFIVDLALDDGPVADQARIGVLAASVLAGLLAWVVFRIADRRRPDTGPRRPTLLDPPVKAKDHIRGNPDAALTLVEYGDFECPFCSRATGSIEEVRRHFGDRLRYVFRHLPLSESHPHAAMAAQAAEAAAAQGKFWEMHDQLFRHPDQLTPDDLVGHAEAIGLDVERFAQDLAEQRFAGLVDHHILSAEASGAEGTPTFFVDGVRHEGLTDARTLIAALESAERSAPAQPQGQD
jgi:NhaA family Na+:H+ antiporter